ncbi:hypothetical protein TNCV_2876541 [Trichonephila clavipes]|nr:hypothetical protein TNCV_2876541 [Trichonephila clavipes]
MTDFVVLSLGQMMRSTPELASSSPASTDITITSPLYTAVLQLHQDSNPRHSGHESESGDRKLWQGHPRAIANNDHGYLFLGAEYQQFNCFLVVP